MTRRNLTRLFVAASLTLAMPALHAEKALSLRVTPRMAGAPAVVSITVTVEPNAENRALVVEDDSDTYYRSSVVPLEGDRASRTHVVVFRGLPPGTHQISAAVRGTSELRAVARTTVTVIGAGSSE